MKSLCLVIFCFLSLLSHAQYGLLSTYPDTLKSFKGRVQKQSWANDSWDEDWFKKSAVVDKGHLRVYYNPPIDLGDYWYEVLIKTDSTVYALDAKLSMDYLMRDPWFTVFDVQQVDVNGRGQKEVVIYYKEIYHEDNLYLIDSEYTDASIEYYCMRIWDLDSAVCLFDLPYEVHYLRTLKKEYRDSAATIDFSMEDYPIEQQGCDRMDTVNLFDVSREKIEVYTIGNSYSEKPVKRKACSYRLLNGVFIRSKQ